ncbi:MAG: hypothetical protein JW712_04515 [Dehalococcoidales bacterium]|nr:hypothetical protein [Dehalococcoidales bacterium]
MTITQVLKKLQKIVGLTISSLFLAFIVYIFLILFTPPRVFLSPLLIAVVLVLSTSIILVNGYVTPKLLKKIETSKWFISLRTWSNRKKAAGILTSMAVIIGLSFINPVYDSIHDKNVLEIAKQQFRTHVYNKSVSQASIDRTIVELEKPLIKLRSQYIDNPPDYDIDVYLFVNVNELIKLTGISEWSSGGALLRANENPIIAIPVEKATSVWNNTLPTSTPLHEITHVVTFEALGQKDINVLPRFITEGIACYESNKGISRFPERFFNRIQLAFFDKSDIEQINTPYLDMTDKNITTADVSRFYHLSDEFVRYLANHFGEDKFWSMVKDVGQGIIFSEAFQKEYKDSFETIYQKFLEYFY